MNNPISSLVVLLFLQIITCLCLITAKADDADTQLYIVYLGHKPHNDHELITDSHHDMLGQVAGSKEEAKKLMLYSYRHGFSGFAAKLTDSQAKQIRELPGVVHVIKNQLYQTHTSRSWDFLGISKNDPKSPVNKGNQGDGIIVGVVDSGIGWEDSSEAFNDKGLGPIPSKWKGSCKSEGNFDAKKYCNRKIIGARWYVKGMIEDRKLNQTMIEEYTSRLDDIGHGTHCAYTIAGSYVNNLTHYGLNMGTVRGGAPLARLAIYKVMWASKKNKQTASSGADMLAAIDESIKDGVDILSVSMGVNSLSNPGDVDEENVLAIGCFHAVSHGIPCVVSGGNEGPDSYTVGNTSPWFLTVAASNSERQIVTPLTLGNNKTILAEGLFGGLGQPFGPLITFTNITKPNELMAVGREVLQGKFVLLFMKTKEEVAQFFIFLKGMKALGFICATPHFDQMVDINKLDGFINATPKPYFNVDIQQGNQIYDYIQKCKFSNQNPVIKFGQSRRLEGKETLVNVPMFSSRGPNSFAPEIMKPDIAAPGVNILSASVPPKADNGFEIMSGTSMSTPHIAGIVALLKVVHPTWSPSAFKSALVTTGWNEDTYPTDIFSDGNGDKFATPFDFGGGICNPNGAMDPGLIYDMDNNDYMNYLWSLGYNDNRIRNVTTFNNSTLAGSCPQTIPSRLDLNLPSISIPNLKTSVTVKRTVTNVGDVNSVYKLVVKPPRNVAIKVTPNILKFNPQIKKITFDVEITSTYQRSTRFTFGSLAWSDDKHFVRIPVAVRKQVDDTHLAS